jgi:hypothetical protein
MVREKENKAPVKSGVTVKSNLGSDLNIDLGEETRPGL